MLNSRRHLGWILPACLLCSSLALRALEAGPNLRKVKFGFPVRLEMVDLTPRKFPLGRLNVLDSAGKPVKDKDGDTVFYAGDGKTLDAVEATPVDLDKGEYWFQFLPADAKSPNWDFDLSFKTPRGKAAGADGKIHWVGKYLLQLKRSGAGASDVTAKGDWSVKPAEKIEVLPSADLKQPLVEFR